MNRKFFLIGLAVFVISILFAIFVPSILLSGQNQNLKINMIANSVLYDKLNLNSTGIIFIEYYATKNITFYVANEVAFQPMRVFLDKNQSALSYAQTLEGKGVFEIIINKYFGLFPSKANYTSYYSNFSILQKDNYYAIFENPNSANVMLSILANVNPATSSKVNYFFIVALVFFVLFVGGIVTMIYSFFKKQDKPKDDDAQAKSMYAIIEKKKQTKKSRR